MFEVTQETMREVSFALCPHCFWLATYFRKSENSCPQCNTKISIQTVTVRLRIQETLQKRVLLKYA